MKSLTTIFKVLTFALAAATAIMFLFEFVTIGDYYGLTGLEISFHSKQQVAGETITTYRSSWYLFAFILSIFTTICSVLNFNFKKKNKISGSKYSTAFFAFATAINLTVLYTAGSIQKYLDIRPLENISNSIITKEIFFLLAFVFSLAAFVFSLATMFAMDYVEVMESNGARLTIAKRIKRFFKDYKSEIKKIVWPSRKTVTKNVLVVLAMCVFVGAFIWVLDFGLAELLGQILGI